MNDSTKLFLSVLKEDISRYKKESGKNKITEEYIKSLPIMTLATENELSILSKIFTDLKGSNSKDANANKTLQKVDSSIMPFIQKDDKLPSDWAQ